MLKERLEIWLRILLRTVSWETAFSEVHIFKHFDRVAGSDETTNNFSILLLPHIFCTVVELTSYMIPFYPPEEFAPLISDIIRVIKIPWRREIPVDALMTAPKKEEPNTLFLSHASLLSLELLGMLPTFDLNEEAQIMTQVVACHPLEDPLTFAAWSVVIFVLVIMRFVF